MLSGELVVPDDPIWQLAAAPNPQVLYDYLHAVAVDDERFAEIAESMQWYSPGFSSVLVAREANDDGTTNRSLQLNFYHPDYPGNEEPHGHSRNALAAWYAPPGTHQVISRYVILDEGAPVVDGTDVEEYAVAANCIIDLKDGRRPHYEPIDLGTRLLLKQSVTNVAPLGSQVFNSTEVHHVGFEGSGVAVSAHFKGPEEPAVLSGTAGLIHYKRLNPAEAEKVVAARQDLAGQTSSASSGDTRLGPATMMYAPVESGISVEASPVTTSSETAEMLIIGALKTAEKLVRANG